VVEQEVAVSIRAATTSRKSIFFIAVLLGVEISSDKRTEI